MPRRCEKKSRPPDVSKSQENYTNWLKKGTVIFWIIFHKILLKADLFNAMLCPGRP